MWPRTGSRYTRSRWKLPDLLDRITWHPTQVLCIEEMHLVTHNAQCSKVGRAVLDDGPVGSPHQALRPKVWYNLFTYHCASSHGYGCFEIDEVCGIFTNTFGYRSSAISFSSSAGQSTGQSAM